MAASYDRRKLSHTQCTAESTRLRMPPCIRDRAESWVHIVERVNRRHNPERLLPGVTTPVQIRSSLDAEGRQYDESMWPPRPSMRLANEQSCDKNLNYFRSMHPPH